MEIQQIIPDENITTLLKKKLEIEKEIESIIQANGFDHFSSKKFVGDLGEYYAYRNIKHFFNDLSISKNSNDSCDLVGHLKKEYAEKWAVPEIVKIEVKTRCGQKGNPHLFGIGEEKFDLLVYVSLYNDYSIHYIGMLKKSSLPNPDKQSRIIFSDKIELVFATNDKFGKHN